MKKAIVFIYYIYNCYNHLSYEFKLDFLYWDIVTKSKAPVHMTDAHLNENPLLVGLRRLLSELRTKLARFACSNSVLRSDAMLAHSRIFNKAYSVMYTGGFLRYWQ